MSLLNEIIYKRLRNLKPRKSKKFIKWAKEKYPEKEIHHILGSMGSLKLNDLLIMPVTREQHLKAEANKIDFAMANLDTSLNILFEYVEFLENKKQ